jgi:HAD superfamily hydrolase (TIGR01549 family)
MKKALEHNGFHRSLSEVSEACKTVEQNLNYQNITDLLDEFWIQWNIRILRHLQITSKVRSLAKLIATRWWDYSGVTLHSDAAEVLPLLKEKGLKLGVVTNGLNSDVNAILPKIGYQTFFDVVVTIDTLRKMKPASEVFHYALTMLEVAAEKTIFVGDEVEADYKGAEASGLTPLLIDREGAREDLDRISSLNELLRLL